MLAADFNLLTDQNDLCLIPTPSQLTVVCFKPRFLVPVDNLLEVPPRTCAAIEFWQQPATFQDLPPEEKPRVGAILMAWQSAMHWFIRLEFFNKARKKYRIPGPRKLRAATQLQGIFLQSLFKLCERVHTLKGGEADLPYTNASWLFIEVAKEMCYWQLMDVYAPPCDLEHRPTKSEASAALKATYENLKRLGNPFNPKLQIHEYRLISAAHELLRNPDFKTDFWQAFLNSFSAWVRYQERNSAFSVCTKITNSEGKRKLAISSGQGSGVVYL